MPYISDLDKPRIDEELVDVLELLNNSKYTIGDINYIFTKILLATNPIKYVDFNALVGVLECCKLEFYRRAVAAYEDEKIKENGDVY